MVWKADFVGPAKLRPGETAQARTERENDECVVGLREPRRAVAANGRVRQIGKALRAMLEVFLATAPEVIGQMIV